MPSGFLVYQHRVGSCFVVHHRSLKIVSSFYRKAPSRKPTSITTNSSKFSSANCPETAHTQMQHMTNGRQVCVTPSLQTVVSPNLEIDVSIISSSNSVTARCYLCPCRCSTALPLRFKFGLLDLTAAGKRHTAARASESKNSAAYDHHTGRALRQIGARGDSPGAPSRAGNGPLSARGDGRR